MSCDLRPIEGYGRLIFENDLSSQMDKSESVSSGEMQLPVSYPALSTGLYYNVVFF